MTNPGTKTKQRQRAAAKRAGSQKRKALRFTHDTASLFKPGQKRRNPTPIGERNTACLLTALSVARQERPKQKREARNGPMTKRRTPRDRVENRADGLRYDHDSGEWKDVTGDNEAPQIGYGRVVARRIARQLAHEMIGGSACS